MRDNTPPESPFLNNGDSDDENLVYIGDLDEVIEEHERENDEYDEMPNADLSEDEDDLSDNELLEREVVDQAELTFSKHTKKVFCGALNPSDTTAVTGGEDDKAFVWDTQSGNVLYEVEGHFDSVIAVQFNHDGSYLATADISGTIQVFKINRSEYRKVWDYDMGDMSWLKWHPAINVLMAGANSGEIYVWRIPSGDCKVLKSDGESCETAMLTADGKRIVAGYTDGAIRLWDIKNQSVALEIASDSPMGFSSSVFCIVTDEDNSTFLAGGDKGRILLAGPNGPLANLQSTDPHAQSIEALGICPNSQFRIAASGNLSGEVLLWDLGRQSIRTSCTQNNVTGITRLTWIDENLFIVGNLTGIISGFDSRTGRQEFELTGHKDSIYDIGYLKSTRRFLTTSSDHLAKIFKLPDNE